MAHQKIDTYAATLDPEVRQAVRSNSAAGTEKRYQILGADFGDPDPLRKLAGAIKQHTIEHLDQYLEQAERSLTANGVKVHFAVSTQDARQAVLDILNQTGCRKVVKSKSMISEEIHLNDFLEEHGLESVETDLGEYIVQIDHDHPSHIVKPILHKNRRDIAKSFEREGLGDYNDDPETITRRARAFLRQKYLQADAAVTGANFVVAESGRMVLVTNEGNSRFCLAGTRVHIALIGVEKLVPHDRDLAVFLNLLARSATGQQLTVYTEFLSGAALSARPSGPREMHVVFVDNGRVDTLASNCREILRCIRCGACMNVCPVYRQASGHAYRSIYPGPLGAVLSPMLAGKNFSQLGDLPKASSLCGACNEVCPVDIPIPDLLLKLRNRAKEEHLPSPGTPPMAPFAMLATAPMLWRTAMHAGVALDLTPKNLIPVPALQEWLKIRTLPAWRGGKFRSWYKHRPAKGKDRQP
ncbi:iron-sulfur cluster-binding protein [Spartobacteria bacterium LR76]|nr:iron-sulfur cluster-binding protein [Spartobacteria bacterium LR76]